MIKSTFGLTQEPFYRENLTLLPRQQHFFNIIKTHSQHGGFSVILGNPGVGKSILRAHIEALEKEPDVVVASFSRTMHTYLNILKQLAESLRIESQSQHLEKELIKVAYTHVRENKTLYILIDEAHLIEMTVLRKLRLLFERFPKKHNLVLFGQQELMVYLCMKVNEDIKTRITYSDTLHPLNDEDLEQFIIRELETVRLGVNTFDKAAIELVLRNAQGNLRLCRNLCYAGLIEACQENKRTVSIRHINDVLIQPHWRSHEDLITQQVAR